MAIGIQPDAIVARTELPLPASVKQKIALFCDVPRDNVIEDPDLPSSYDAPVTLHENGLTRCITLGLSLPAKEPDLSEWARRVGVMRSATTACESPWSASTSSSRTRTSASASR